MVKRFGGDVEAILPVGGFAGQLLRRLIRDEGISNRIIEVDAETREDFSVSELSTDAQYRFVLPGEPLGDSEWRACLSMLAATTPAPKFVVGSGSLPPGVPDDFYAQAAAIARNLGAKFALDIGRVWHRNGVAGYYRSGNHGGARVAGCGCRHPAIAC